MDRSEEDPECAECHPEGSCAADLPCAAVHGVPVLDPDQVWAAVDTVQDRVIEIRETLTAAGTSIAAAAEISKAGSRVEAETSSDPRAVSKDRGEETASAGVKAVARARSLVVEE